MAGSALPRELQLLINQIANDRTHYIVSNPGYRKAYREEKARLLAQVVTWLAMGKTLNEILENLRARCPKKKAELKAIIEALRKKVWETH